MGGFPLKKLGALVDFRDALSCGRATIPLEKIAFVPRWCRFIVPVYVPGLFLVQAPVIGEATGTRQRLTVYG